jgi:hypothetical protein
VPVPSIITLSSIVGFAEVLQQRPLDSIEAPPSLDMVPPEVALVWVIPVTFSVVRTGRSVLFVQELKNKDEVAKSKVMVIKTLLAEIICVFTIPEYFRIKHLKIR